MTKLYIRIVDGSPVDHPILEETLLSAFPGIDLENSSEYIPFRREFPFVKVYEINEGVEYKIDENGVCYDHWNIRSMTPEERQEAMDVCISNWNASPSAEHNPSWVFNEELCKFQPPIPYPTDGGTYKWRESDISWVLVP